MTPDERAEILRDSDEREADLQLRHDAFREGLRLGRTAGNAEGRSAAEREISQAWHEVAAPVARGGPSYAELESARWAVHGEPRTRETFGQPHPDDYLGREAEAAREAGKQREAQRQADEAEQEPHRGGQRQAEAEQLEAAS
jgi:hypothetical protein